MTSRSRRIAAMVAVAAGVAAAVPLTVGAPAGAVSKPEVVADSLNNPYKMSFGPDGHLYVAEGGLGGDGPCLELPEGGDLCVGPTGSVTQIDLENEDQHRLAAGLPSIAPSDSGGNGARGPVDVTVDDEGNLFVVMSLGGPPAGREALGEDGAFLGTVVQVTPDHERTVFADLAAFEKAENPDADQPDAAEPDTNPFAIEDNPAGGFWAVDAGGNDLVSIDAEGNISLEAVLPFEETEARIPYQPVPTSVTAGPAGVLVTELTGFPFPVGESDVFSFDEESSALTVVESGFSAVVDAAQGPDGSVYVLEFASNGLLAAESGEGTVSRLTQIRPDGGRKTLLQDELFVPNGVAVGPDGMVYVSNGSQSAGTGFVIRVDPGVAGDPATAAACDPDDVPGSGFSDIAGDVHHEAIECLAWWGIIRGTTIDTFNPWGHTNRSQVASIVARLLGVGGVELPTAPPDAFSDDDGNPHEANINALAAIGVLLGKDAQHFDTGSPVSRGQMASILARAYEAITGEVLPAGARVFGDDDGSVHEAAISAVAWAGWVNGTTPVTFDPDGDALRSQLASMVARMLSTLVEEGQATLPAG